MVTKLTSVKTVIAKVIADLDLKEDDMRITDMREWAAEAIEKIGAVTQFIHKVSGQDGTPITVLHAHQAPLPCDLHQLHQVAYSFNCDGPWFPMRKATGSFAVWGHEDCCGCDCYDCLGHKLECRHEDGCEHCCPNMLVPDDTMVKLVIDMIGNIDKTEALELLNTNQNLRTIVSNLINQHTVGAKHCDGYSTANPSWGFQYSIKPGYIMCNVPCGYLKLSYSAVPTDEDGYTLIPDMTSYTEAIYWYITMKMMYPKLLRGEINRQDYYDIRRSWNFYRQQAYAEALMPNEDGLESLKNNWNKIVPEFRDHNSFYSHTGERQIIYNANDNELY